MLKKIFFLIIFFILSLQCAEKHITSYPFISGDSFWNFCDFIIDADIPFNPKAIKLGSVILVQADFFEKFFNQDFPEITAPFIIVSPNSGTQADNPMPGKYRPYLDSEKIIGWFAQNIDGEHQKLYALPIGLANQNWGHGNIHVFKKYLKKKESYKRDKLLYMNFTESHPERAAIFNYFTTKPFCTVIMKPKSLNKYLKDLCQHKFCLSPRGGGLDCHRTWESLLMGCYPIVKRSSIEPVYKDLPVVIIDDWTQVTEEFLTQKYDELNKKPYNFKKLFAPYWFKKIINLRESYLIALNRPKTCDSYPLERIESITNAEVFDIV